MSQFDSKMVLLAVILIICGVSEAAVYKVGDSNGWTSIGHVDYKAWAASKHFHVGDTIMFEYRKEFHNVVRVTHDNYNLCSATEPYGTWTSGNDSFTITKPGHYFFMCGFPNHCKGGQRVDIRVPASSTAPAPKASSPYGAPKSSPTLAPKAYPPHVAPKSSPTAAPKASAPYVAPKASSIPPRAPKASSPHVAPKSSPTPTVAPKASSPYVAPKASSIPPVAPKASSPYVAPQSSDTPLPPSPAPSPKSTATRSWTTKHLFVVPAIVSLFCF